MADLQYLTLLRDTGALHHADLQWLSGSIFLNAFLNEGAGLHGMPKRRFVQVVGIDITHTLLYCPLEDIYCKAT